MTLAVVRSLGDSPRRLRSPQELEDFEQELVDQYALAMSASGVTDGHVAADRSAVFEFTGYLGRPLWTAGPEDADGFLRHQRRDRRLSRSTVYRKSCALARFYEFLLARYQGEIHALTGHVICQPVDEYNRPVNPAYGEIRIPPSDAEVDLLFAAWRESLPGARKYLPAARDYFAASLWRRAGLRINETVMLDIRDWRPDLGELGKLHVRHGKGSMGRGPKGRLVPAIDSVGGLVEWWLADVRHQFGDDWEDPDAPLLPSERRDRDTGHCTRAGSDALRSGLAGAVATWLPGWAGRLTPHVLRHYCASSLYARGLDLKPIQDILGHEWLSTTTRYLHVHDAHIEKAWAAASARVAGRLDLGEG